ncbi:tyrosine-type recombinase/integrase [Bacillus cereus group sp. BfR-BA-01349]|uniref:tyrosine-type recombinase/integrase n=1 Tax=Bacillus cereus group sp. BfR-BA-01349 TaxID=2920312 RepID=UPI001F586C1F
MSEIIVQGNLTDRVLINNTSIRMYTNDHFNDVELKALFKNVNMEFRKCRTIPVNELLHNASIPSYVKQKRIRYLRMLAFFQRYRFSLEEIFDMKKTIRRFKYPIEIMPNFHILNKLLSQHYQNWFKHHGEDNKIFEKIKDVLESLVLRLWLAGYGLVQGVGLEPLTNETLLNVLDKLEVGSTTRSLYRNACIFLSYALLNESNSLINEPIKIRVKQTVLELEKKRWNQTLDMYPIELAKIFKEYVFNVLYRRTKGQLIVENKDSEGRLQRKTLAKITTSTFKNHSRSLSSLCTYLSKCNCLTIDDVLKGKLFEVFYLITENYKKTTLKQYSSSTKSWLEYYFNENKLAVNISTVIPTTRIGKKNTRYGKHIDFIQATKLIEVLLDDQSPYHKDNDLLNFRNRRVCLIQLETGKRIHEVAVLKKNCLIKNKYNDVFIEFHKTKSGKPSRVSLSKEGQRWIHQLQELSPILPIDIDSKFYLFGDDLNTYRLLADHTNLAPYSRESLKYYLSDLQKKIWGDSPPGGRFFSTHDMRRMCATYMKLKGYNEVEIADRLGQENLKSQFTYTLTMGNETLQKYSEIAQTGLYGIKLDFNSNVVKDYHTIDAEEVLGQTSMIIDNLEDEKIAKKFIEKIFREVGDIDFSNNKLHKSSEMISGYPLRTHNCKAHTRVTCFHTSLKCYKCDKYSPEKDTLLNHKSEIVRWIVFLHHNESLLKQAKDLVEKRVLPHKIDGIKTDLDEAFGKLFVKFDSVDANDVNNIEKELYGVAKKYIKRYYKQFPNPTVAQMDMFLEKGDINGQSKI